MFGRFPQTPGELNYVIHKELFKEYIDENIIVTTINTYLHDREPSYTLYNSVMGVLECVYREFMYRQPPRPALYKVADTIRNLQRWLYDEYLLPYETEKRKLNGDVYPSRIE